MSCVVHVTNRILYLKEMQGDLFVYKHLKTSFTAFLERFGLLHVYELPLSTPLLTLIERVAQDMQTSEFQYYFTESTRSIGFTRSETLPLQLTEVVNRGLERRSDRQIRLRRAAISPEMTIATVYTSRAYYGAPALAVDGNHFVIHLGKS